MNGDVAAAVILMLCIIVGATVLAIYSIRQGRIKLAHDLATELAQARSLISTLYQAACTARDVNAMADLIATLIENSPNGPRALGVVPGLPARSDRMIGRFTPDELEVLAETAGELFYAYGDKGDLLSAKQKRLAGQVWAYLQAE